MSLLPLEGPPDEYRVQVIAAASPPSRGPATAAVLAPLAVAHITHAEEFAQSPQQSAASSTTVLVITVPPVTAQSWVSLQLDSSFSSTPAPSPPSPFLCGGFV